MGLDLKMNNGVLCIDPCKWNSFDTNKSILHLVL